MGGEGDDDGGGREMMIGGGREMMLEGGGEWKVMMEEGEMIMKGIFSWSRCLRVFVGWGEKEGEIGEGMMTG